MSGGVYATGGGAVNRGASVRGASPARRSESPEGSAG
jgi:hypothetical protein